MTSVESITHTQVGVLTLIDRFAQLRGTRGLMPGPIPPVRFSLVARRLPAGLTPLDVPIVLSPVTGASGAYLFPDERRSGDSSYRIEPGTYQVLIESDYYQTLTPEVDWPPSPQNTPVLNLSPGFAYPFPDLTLSSTGLTLLRGTLLRTVTGAPIAGALVELTDPPAMGSFATATTDASGSWVLVLPVSAAPPILAKLRFTLPEGAGVVNVPNVALALGKDNSLAQTALRGSVVSTGNIPLANAQITVSTQPGTVQSGRDGKWTFYMSLLQPDGAARVTATASNGRTAFQDVAVRNRATVVVPVLQIAN